MSTWDDNEYPYNSIWFDLQIESSSEIEDLRTFVRDNLAVDSTAPEFNGLVTRSAWTILKLVERWNIEQDEVAGKSRVRVLIDDFINGQASAAAVEQSVKDPRAAEAVSDDFLGDKVYALTPTAVDFFKHCAAACAAANARDARREA